MIPWSRIVRQRLQAAHRQAEERGGLRRMKLRATRRERVIAWISANAWIAAALSMLADAPKRAPRIPYPPRVGLPRHVHFFLCRARRRMIRAARAGPEVAQAYAHVLGLAHHYGNRGIARALKVTPPRLPGPLATPEAIRRRTDRLAPSSTSGKARWLLEARHAFETGSDVLRLLTSDDTTG